MTPPAPPAAELVDLAAAIQQRWTDGEPPDAQAGHAMHAPAPRPAAALAAFRLTPRQTDVLALLLQGKPNKLIARDLNLSVETVKDHVAAVLRTLNVSSRTQAVLAVSQMNQQGGLNAWRGTHTR